MAAKPACTDPKHHVHDADDYVHEVEHACAERGLRLTPLRADVLRLVADSKRPMKAYDLLAQISESKAASAPPTIYRALDFLLENGFIHKLESINAFVACHHPRVQHTVPFLICDNCHAAVEMEDERISQQLEDKARALGFTPQAQTLEVHGLCADCSKPSKLAHAAR
ncbi:MAG: transcriptional repressor [Lysobacteraceae bacterium]